MMFEVDDDDDGKDQQENMGNIAVVPENYKEKETFPL